MRIVYQGRTLEFDDENLNIDEMREIKRKLGFTIKGFLEAIEQVDPDAVTGLYWILMRSDGTCDDLALTADMQFPLGEFLSALADAQTADAESEADPTSDGDPQGSSTQRSTGSSQTTSGVSQTSTSPRSRAGTDTSRGTSDVSHSGSS